MKTGIEAFTEERKNQIEKHGFTGQHHANHPEWYDRGQLVDDASTLLLERCDLVGCTPINWDIEWFERLCQKTFKERLEIAGALLAAEWDRQKALGNF